MLAQRIFEWAKRAPDKPALISGEYVWTYAAFADAIARARGCFIRNGLVESGVVSITVEDQAQVWVLTLALRSLGITTMNRGFDLADAPMLRCAIRSAGEKIPTLAYLCRTGGVPLLEVSIENEAPVGLDDGPQVERPGGQILHTSGTTGVHKKVLIDPSLEDALLAKRIRASAITEDSVLSVFTCPVWTGAGYKSPASVWSVGGTVVIDPTTPFGTLRHASLTHAVLTPLILRAILALPADAFPRNERLLLHYAGGTLSWAEIEEAKRRITPHIINGLGATETGAFGMTPVETPEDLRWHRLFPEVEVQLVDDDDRPVPTGTVGRVRVSTAGGPNAYLNDDEATATFFRNGYFYPGDLGVLREDGRLALQGRVTEVINIDGVKISPARPSRIGCGTRSGRLSSCSPCKTTLAKRSCTWP